MKCRFAYKCPLYQLDAVCCNNDEEAIGYCGKWKEFDQQNMENVKTE